MLLFDSFLSLDKEINNFKLMFLNESFMKKNIINV